MTHPPITWTDDFLIGIAELDYEHKSLIDSINELHRELADHDETDKIEATLGEIHARMQAHFALEEHYMLEHDYDGYIGHKKEHEMLLDEYTRKMIHFENNPVIDDRHNMGESLNNWIIEHILSSDRRMSSLVADKAT